MQWHYKHRDMQLPGYIWGQLSLVRGMARVISTGQN